MSLYAAIGYALGIMIFALFIRRRRTRLIDKHKHQAEIKRSNSKKGN